MKTYLHMLPGSALSFFFLISFIHPVPVRDFLICIFDSDSVRAILSRGVVNCVGAITIVLNANWLGGAWK